MKFLRHRIADERVLRLIGKWLAAGVIEDGTWTDSEEGSPQGASVSPLLANVYLHYVLDLWADWWRKRHARGDVIIVRFADDFIVGFEYQDDAERFLDGAARQVREVRPGAAPRQDPADRVRAARRPEARRRGARGSRRRSRSWDSRTSARRPGAGGSGSGGRPTRRRMRAKLKSVKAELMRRRHLPVPEQGRWLASVVRGHQAYYAVPGNTEAVNAFRTQTARHWHQALRRRSQKPRLTWDRMNRLVDPVAAPDQNHAPVPGGALRRQIPKAGAQCGSPARWDLRGGPPARAVPTATRFRQLRPAKVARLTTRRDRDAGAAPWVWRIRDEDKGTSRITTGERAYGGGLRDRPPTRTGSGR